METLAHKIHLKADFEKVTELVSELRIEMVAQIGAIKKEIKKKAAKKKGEIEVSVREQEFAHEKLFEEIRSFKDKLTKLANQFDKELVERDKALKQFQTGLWDDIQAMLTSIQEDTSSTSKLCSQLANLKADKKELNERMAKLSVQVQEMVTCAELKGTMSALNSDCSQKMLDLRSEVFSRMTDLN